MMPKLPYLNSKTKKSVTKFLGINYTENLQEGQIVDAEGVTTENYPTLSPREDRTAIPTYESVTDMFEWNGKFVIVDGTSLYFDHVLICNVTLGKKQFAVVNTHLIVMPDGVDIDMSSYTETEGVGSYTFTYLNASVSTLDVSSGSSSSSTFANGIDITASTNPILGWIQCDMHLLDERAYSFWSWHSGNSQPYWYTYGTDQSAVRACWNGTSWDTTALAALEKIAITINEEETPHDTTLSSGNSIFIPTQNGESLRVRNGVTSRSGISRYANKDYSGNKGYYAVVGSSDEPSDWYTGSRQVEDEEGNVYIENYINGGIAATIYSVTGQVLFSAIFEVGELVSVTTGDDDYDVAEAKVISFDDTTNKITIKAYDSTEGTWTANAFSSTTKSFQTSITVARRFPTLDYICERGNRLWGVSNADRTIYASELGVPKNMVVFDGTDAEPYSVAVGSEGDFTGIISYGGATLCFKENSLTKVLGDYPSNFYTTEYKIAGVQSGSEKSLQIVNETLLYKGTQGVYSYSGSTPTLISNALGRDVYTNAVGGHDGERYYISMEYGTEKFLFTYDLINGLWMKEDSIKADAFTRATDFYMASGGIVYKLCQSGDKDFDWYAELAPFYAMAKASSGYSQTIGKQLCTKIYLLADMEKGSRLRLEVKYDNGGWKSIYTKLADRYLSLNIPVKLERCDVLHIRFKGHGDVKIRQLIREYTIGSTR